MNHVIGLDIGGANLKISNGVHYHRHEPFALWQAPADLSSKLRELLQAAPEHELVAITMTGELTDCFANKQEGVRFILEAIERATNCPIRVYLVGGQFVTPDEASRQTELAAASNWYALASQVATSLPSCDGGLLMDTGSTTTDLIPFACGKVLARGQDDFHRLTQGELVYTGASRSSLAGIVSQVTHRGQVCPVMNEQFATTLDCHRLLGNLPADSNDYYTADGEGVSTSDCVRRLARLIGKDETTFDLPDALEIAKQIYSAQVAAIGLAAQQVLENQGFASIDFIASGQGDFLAEDVFQWLKFRGYNGSISRLSEQESPLASACATARSIALLAKAECDSNHGIFRSQVT